MRGSASATGRSPLGRLLALRPRLAAGVLLSASTEREHRFRWLAAQQVEYDAQIHIDSSLVVPAPRLAP
jgi:hypothetical protein